MRTAVIHRMAMKRGNRWLLCASAATILLLDAQIDQSLAAPVTFAFDAEVVSVLSSNGGANLPFSISAGDALTASFTFEPTTGGPVHPQSGVFSFQLPGGTLNLSGYQISVLDENAPNASPIPGSIADPSNTPIIDQGPGSSDNIAFSCLAEQGLYCGSIAEHSELKVWPIVHFSTDANLLDSSDLVADLEIWNGFSFREMSLSFINSDTGGETYVGAYVGLVRQVPEPDALWAALSATAMLLILLSFRLRSLEPRHKLPQ